MNDIEAKRETGGTGNPATQQSLLSSSELLRQGSVRRDDNNLGSAHSVPRLSTDLGTDSAGCADAHAASDTSLPSTI
jgi:hypothetical protein